MEEGWTVKSQVSIRNADGSRTTKPLEDLTEQERKAMRERWICNLALAGYETREEAS